MLIPRYYFYNDFTELYDYFLTQPHIKKTFLKNEYLWKPGEPLSIIFKALSEMEVLSFTREDFYRMFQDNPKLNALMFEWYAMYINLLIYESAHQEYNNSFIKLCNLLYLFSQNSPSGQSLRVDLTQENIADILTVNRVNAARSLLRLRDEGIIEPHRKWIEILDLDALASYCSQETLLP